MKTLTAKDARYDFGRVIDLVPVEPNAGAKHGRPVVVGMSVEEFEPLKDSRRIGGGTEGDGVTMLSRYPKNCVLSVATGQQASLDAQTQTSEAQKAIGNRKFMQARSRWP